MANLSSEQKRFIERYANSKGDFYGVINSLGLSPYHVLSWQSNPEFDEEYRKVKNLVILQLKQENYVLGLSRLNQILTHGLITSSHTLKKKSCPDGDIYEDSITTKNNGVPIAAINKALEDSSIIKALTTFANEGLIPVSVAKNILEASNRMSSDVIAAFGIDENQSEFVNDKKALALIKAAVLGEIDP